MPSELQNIWLAGCVEVFTCRGLKDLRGGPTMVTITTRLSNTLFASFIFNESIGKDFKQGDKVYLMGRFIGKVIVPWTDIYELYFVDCSLKNENYGR